MLTRIHNLHGDLNLMREVRGALEGERFEASCCLLAADRGRDV
jgi:queuine/archaeosine tRNA-ribosyltransferase